MECGLRLERISYLSLFPVTGLMLHYFFLTCPIQTLKQAQNDIFLYALLMGVLPHKGKCGYLVAGCPTTAVDSNKTDKC